MSCTEQHTDANSLRHRTDAANKYTIYPYVHSFSNIPNTDALLRAITIPAVLPTSLPSGVDFSLVAGLSSLLLPRPRDPPIPAYLI